MLLCPVGYRIVSLIVKEPERCLDSPPISSQQWLKSMGSQRKTNKCHQKPNRHRKNSLKQAMVPDPQLSAAGNASPD